MLTKEPTDDGAKLQPTVRRGPGVILLLVGTVIGVLILRHDFWNWTDVEPRLFGFLPVGLWWQGMVSLCASGMMWLMVRLAWPGDLEIDAIAAEKIRLERTGRHAGPGQ